MTGRGPAGRSVDRRIAGAHCRASYGLFGNPPGDLLLSGGDCAAEGLRRTGVEVTGLSKLCHTRAISAVLSVVWPRPYAGMFTRGEQTVGKWRFVVSAVYPRCTIPENDKVNIAL